MLPKFRVWDKHKKQMIEWIDLDLSKDSGEDDITVFEPTGIVRGAFLMPILLQSTGLKDRNGVEIFEGDIVNVHEFINVGGIEGYEEGEKETIGIIEYGCLYDSPIPEWYLQIKDDCVSFSYIDLHDESFEVVGNIYKHPHLLEGDTE